MTARHGSEWPGAGWWRAALACCGLAGLIGFQAWAYLERLTLSLGPRVILQPWLLQKGWLAYENMADQHTPLMPLLFVPLRLLVPDGLQLAALVLVALLSLTTLLVFVAARRAGGRPVGLAAALVFVAWSPAFGFNKLWHEGFLAPLYLILLLLYDPSARRRGPLRWVLVGVVGGCAVLIKQHAAAVLAVFMIWNAVATRRAGRPAVAVRKQAALIGLGALLPAAAYAAVHLARAGSLRDVLYWTITFNLTSSYDTLAAHGPTAAEIRLLAVSALALPAVLVCGVRLKRRGDPAWLTLGCALSLLAAGSLTAYPRFALFHLAAVLPMLAWLSVAPLAAALKPGTAGRWLAAGLGAALLAVWLFTALPAYRPVLATGRPRTIIEYSDLVPLAEQISERVRPGDGLYLFPDDEATSNLYYLCGQQPPGFWVFTYPWYMREWVDRRIAATLATHPPRWVVSFPGRDGIEQSAPVTTEYLREHYQRAVRLSWLQGEAWLLERTP